MLNIGIPLDKIKTIMESLVFFQCAKVWKTISGRLGHTSQKRNNL